MRYDAVEQNFNIDETTGLRTGKTIVLTFAKSKKLYPEKLRLVEFYDAQNDELLLFLTNNFEISALEVANLYKHRWQIEVFFKWIKQNLSIKSFGDIPKMQSGYNFGWQLLPICLSYTSNTH
jgi:IS4 transposase